MKLKEYLEKLNKLAKDNPESLDMDVVYSTGDEGNRTCHVKGQPRVARYEPMPWVPKTGDMVLVQDSGQSEWVEAEYLFSYSGLYYTKGKAKGLVVDMVVWGHMKELKKQKPELSGHL